MRYGVPRRIRRFLRSPRVIIAEVAAIALAGIASTLIPQAPNPTEAVRFAERHPIAAPIAAAAGLDRVFTSPWFLALVILSVCSLGVVTWEQWARAVREWRSVPRPDSFAGASHRIEFERSPRHAQPGVRVTTRGRIAAFGAPLFHTGLILLVLAGVARLLWSAEAAATLYEKESLPATPAAFPRQSRGWLASPLALPVPLRLEEIVPEWHETGGLKGLAATVSVGEGPSASSASLAINTPLGMGPHHRVYLSQAFGVAAFVEVLGSGEPLRLAVLLDREDDGTYSGKEALRPGTELRLRAGKAAGAEVPPGIEVRMVDGEALRVLAKLRPGTGVSLPDGTRVVLHDLRWWARLTVTRDTTVWPAYAGLALVAIGALLMGVATRVDILVATTPLGERERVLVALRARRFAPLYTEQFEHTVRDEGGPARAEG